MSVSKLYISKKLIEGYEGAPPLLKEHVITKLAIQLCQKVELTEVSELELVRPISKYCVYRHVWDRSNKKRAAEICERLPLPPAVKKLVIARIRPIALQLFSWNRQHEVMFDFSPLFAYTLLTPFDWTVEGRLNEKKIAERLVQDYRIPVFQRYRIACWNCLEISIHALWIEIPPEQRQTAFDADKSKLVQLWSYQSAGRVEEFIEDKDMFWKYLLKYGVSEGSSISVLYCWDELPNNVKQDVLYVNAMKALTNIYDRYTGNWMNYPRDNEWLASQLHYTDILFFLITQMSEEQKIEFFEEELLDSHACIFMQWPYLDLLIPITKSLWDILPEAYYSYNIFILAYRYINSLSDLCCIGSNDYVDDHYGALLIELLEETPDHLKRYMFSDKENSKNGRKLLLDVIKKCPLEIRNIKIFQHIFQHLTLKEKQSFLKSDYGYQFCGYLALKENWQLLNWTLRESLPEGDVIKFKMELFRSEMGEDICCYMLEKINEMPLISFLNWGFLSKGEIVQFMSNIFIKEDWLNAELLLDDDFKWGIEMDCFYNIIKAYAPSLHAARIFKKIFVKKYSRHLCINFITHSKWKEVDRFLTWGFHTERARKHFKKCFAKEHAMYVCEHHLKNSSFQEAERFLTWCFSTKRAVKKFKQELFFFSGVEIQWYLLLQYLPDFDTLIKWFELNPDATLRFRKDVLFRSTALNNLFDMLSKALIFEWEFKVKERSDDILYCMEFFFKWGLPDEETVVAFKNASKMYLMGVPFSNIKNRQWLQQNWDKLLSKRLSDLST